jgi:pimeloyl-ACP methyl ester carboxylesterase
MAGDGAAGIKEDAGDAKEADGAAMEFGAGATASAAPRTSGSVLLLLHGGGMSSESWGPFAKEVVAKLPGCAVVAVDFRGHGSTVAMPEAVRATLPWRIHVDSVCACVRVTGFTRPCEGLDVGARTQMFIPLIGRIVFGFSCWQNCCTERRPTRSAFNSATSEIHSQLVVRKDCVGWGLCVGCDASAFFLFFCKTTTLCAVSINISSFALLHARVWAHFALLHARVLVHFALLHARVLVHFAILHARVLVHFASLQAGTTVLPPHSACQLWKLQSLCNSVRTQDLSKDTLCADVLAVVEELQKEIGWDAVYLMGHSMGGAVAVHVAATGKISNVAGVIVVDVVEGSALEAHSYMREFLASRPASFPSVEAAVDWTLASGAIKNRESAMISVRI